MRKVEVRPYDPAWSDEFRREAKRLKEVLGDLALDISHIGSTSVPGLAAKPVIDILVTVRRIGEVDPLNPKMAELGCIAKGENGIPGRRYFSREHREGPYRIHTHHVHVFETGSPHILRHLAFRDYLRSRPDEAERYGRLKLELVRRYPTDIDRYIEGKSGLVAELEARALRWRKERE